MLSSLAADRQGRPHWRRVWKQAGTAILDADAFGRLYVAPVELRSFEADGGLTNKQNVRMETNATYTVERLPAALRIL